MPELRGEVTEVMDNFVDEMVNQGYYPSRAELQRDAVRKLMLDMEYSPSLYPNLENRETNRGKLDEYPEEWGGGEE